MHAFNVKIPEMKYYCCRESVVVVDTTHDGDDDGDAFILTFPKSGVIE